MNRVNSNLIAELAQDLRPVRALRSRDGMMVTLAAAAASVVMVALLAGIWTGIVEGVASPFFFLANGLLAVFGFACAADVVRMASPGVGNRYGRAGWLLAMLGVLPVVAFLSVPLASLAREVLGDPYGLKCALAGSAAAIATGSALTLWLRRGAPVSPPRAGLFTGMASGALGSAAYGLSCHVDSLGHLAIWHVLPVAIAGLVGRAVLPPILRW